MLTLKLITFTFISIIYNLKKNRNKMGHGVCCGTIQNTDEEKQNQIKNTEEEEADKFNEEEEEKQEKPKKEDGEKKVEKLTNFYGAANCAYTKTMTK